jgi:cardiolipin synthase
MTPHLLSTTVLVAHWLLAIGLSLRVITRRPPVGVAVAWIAVMFSVPFVGAALYLLFGEKRLGRRHAARVAACAPRLEQWQGRLREQAGPPATRHGSGAHAVEALAEHLIGFPAQSGNRIELLDAYPAIVDALVADIDHAGATCHLAFYIWQAQGRTLDVVDALIRAAGRGVECRALADTVGSKAFLRGQAAIRLRAAGVEVRAALPTGRLPALLSRVDLRNHRKIAVIDGGIAYAGSQNLADPRCFMHGAGAGEWVDAMVRITGPAAGVLAGVFALDWAIESGSAFAPPATQPVDPVAPTAPRVQVAPSGPGLQADALHQLLLAAIYGSCREIVMTTPYFVPDDAIVTALCSAAQRGVEVTLVVPARNNSRLVRYASAAFFDELLSAGVCIALFHGGLLHTKSLAIDGGTSVFGSVNLDMRSFWLNFEISLLIYDEDFTARLRALQRGYLDNADGLDLAAWRQRPRWRRFTEDAVRLLGPVL